MSKQIHYNIDKITEEDANYNLIYGEKSNGKSYQVKHKKAIEHYLETGNRFILLRRWKDDITNLWIEQYFSDVDVEKLTNGDYNCISCYRRVIYLGIYNQETGKTDRIEKIGYAVALSQEQHFSGASFLDVDTIIFEEFMERGVYISREPDKLMTFYSTVDRKRGTTKLWMVGNSISKVCPYIVNWELDEIFRTQKQGEIKTKIIHNEENDVKIAIEYCRSSGGKTMAIGNASGMIDKGGWQTNPQPHLPKSKNEYKILYRFGFQYQNFRFLAEYLLDRETKECIWFIYPKYTDFKNDLLIISDKVKPNIRWQRDIYNMTIRNEKLKNLMKNTFRECNIFYSSDLCGTDFKQLIDFVIKK